MFCGRLVSRPHRGGPCAKFHGRHGRGAFGGRGEEGEGKASVCISLPSWPLRLSTSSTLTPLDVCSWCARRMACPWLVASTRSLSTLPLSRTGWCSSRDVTRTRLFVTLAIKAGMCGWGEGPEAPSPFSFWHKHVTRSMSKPQPPPLPPPFPGCRRAVLFDGSR